MPNEDEAKLIKKGDYDEAFDTLARFLFEQYRKKKQAESTGVEDTEVDKS